MDRKYEFSVVASDLTMIRLPKIVDAVYSKVRGQLNEIVKRITFIHDVPFDYICLAFLNGLRNDDVPRYRRINEQWKDLPIAIELDSLELRHASCEELTRLHMVAALKALVHVGKKYNRPYEVFEQMLGELTWGNLLVLTGASLTTHYRNPETYPVQQEIMRDLAEIMRETGYLSNAPFSWVNISLGFAEQNANEPKYMEIHGEWDYLMMAIDLETIELRHAPRNELRRLLEKASLKALVHAGRRFELPARILEERLVKITQVG